MVGFFKVKLLEILKNGKKIFNFNSLFFKKKKISNTYKNFLFFSNNKNLLKSKNHEKLYFIKL